MFAASVKCPCRPFSFVKGLMIVTFDNAVSFGACRLKQTAFDLTFPRPQTVLGLRFRVEVRA